MGYGYKSKKDPSILKKIIFATIVLIIIVAVIVMKNYFTVKNSPFSVSEETSIEITEDSNFNTIFDKLKEENYLKNYLFTKVYLKLNERSIDTKVIPGSYSIKSDMSLSQFMKNINEGNFDDTYVNVTIPEGYTIDDIGELLQEKGIIKDEEFIKGIKSYKLPDYINHNENKRYDLEGYLFPNTYNLKVGEEPDKIIDKFLKTFEDTIKKIEENSGKKIEDKDLDTIITKAAMIEKESRVDEERPIIASVIENRLNINMELKIDATVLYALGYHKDMVTFNDLEIDSPYNTYKVKGLPAGAICNPGEKSIEAVINPASTDYLFYVLQDENTHYFTNNDVDFMNKLKELGY